MQSHEVLQLVGQRLFGGDVGRDGVTGAVRELVGAEAVALRQHEALVVELDRLVGVHVVVDEHPRVADDDRVADLARRQPRDRHLGDDARRELHRHERHVG